MDINTPVVICWAPHLCLYTLFFFFFFFFFLLSDHKHGGVYSLQVNPYCMRGGGEATPPQST